MQAMVHRGPDDEGYEQFSLTDAPSGPTCGFGFRRLAIMDLSPLGHQPMINPATGDAIIFNGEIYNYRTLRGELEASGCTFRSSGDTEVLLQALATWGEKALERLDGMFAFAFYHAARNRVMLARDPLGIKPLYVARSSGTLVFASEVRAVLASGLVPTDIDPAGVAGFLAYGTPQDPLTIHRSIRSMPSGSREWITAETLETDRPGAGRYWRFPIPIAPGPEAGVLSTVDTLLNDSVRLQCRSDVPLGVFLSGGIDSATMAALAASTNGPPSTFAVGYDAPGAIDETAAAAESADWLGTRHFQSVVDRDWVTLLAYEWLKAADRPSIDGLNTYIISGAVRDRGIAVALSGLGADELFGGYPSFSHVPRYQRLLRLVALLPASVRRAAATVVFAPLPSGQRGKAVDLVSSNASALELTLLTRRVLPDRSLLRLGLSPRRLGLSPQYLATEAYDSITAESHDTLQAVSEAEISFYMGNVLLRDSDANSMAHSLEIRVPFLGQNLVDYVCSLPGTTRAPFNSAPKHLLRRIMAKRLPPEVFARPKSGFSLPFSDWIFGPLRDQCEAAIEALACCTFLDSKTVRSMWADYESKRRQTHWSRPLALVALGNYLGSVPRVTPL
jgi:asparagine synthase (glutamine-hydrolysing)